MSVSSDVLAGSKSADADISHTRVSFNLEASSVAMATSDTRLNASQGMCTVHYPVHTAYYQLVTVYC